GHLEHQLVVHLHDHAGIDTALPKPAVDADHRPLDDVGRRPLHRGVDGRALGVLAPLVVACLDIRDVETPPEHRLHITLFARPLTGLVHVALYAGIAGEVGVDIALGGGAVDAELPRQAEGGHPVDQ